MSVVLPLPSVTTSGCAAPCPRPGTTRPRSVSVHGGERGLAMSLYARLGEEVGVRTAVDEFHPRVVADPQLAHHVEDVALPQLRPHRTALLAAGHAGPGITAPAF